MNVMQVYQQAIAAVAAKKATPEQELIVAMWGQVQDQEATINAQAYKISVYETKEFSEFEKQSQYDEAMKALNKVRYTH